MKSNLSLKQYRERRVANEALTSLHKAHKRLFGGTVGALSRREMITKFIPAHDRAVAKQARQVASQL